MDHISIGQLGEDIACHLLESNGCRILERNYRKPWGEIDIVAKERDGTLVFVEVKALKRHPEGLTPEDNMSRAKIEKTKRVCEMYAEYNLQLMNESKGWRIDLIAITIPKQLADMPKQYDLTKVIRYCKVRYYPNIS